METRVACLRDRVSGNELRVLMMKDDSERERRSDLEMLLDDLYRCSSLLLLLLLSGGSRRWWCCRVWGGVGLGVAGGGGAEGRRRRRSTRCGKGQSNDSDYMMMVKLR